MMLMMMLIGRYADKTPLPARKLPADDNHVENDNDNDCDEDGGNGNDNIGKFTYGNSGQQCQSAGVR